MIKLKNSSSETIDVTKSLTSIRDNTVVKSNDLIQKSRFQLSLQEQKIILYLISKIKPDDITFFNHDFKISTFCEVCGIDSDNGKNYKNIKETIKHLADKSLWITLDNGTETLVRWIEKAVINKKSGIISIKFDDEMKPYFLQLREKFTQYELIYILAMSSMYSVRLYELLKSYEFRHFKIFDIDHLKQLLSAEKYIRFSDFKRFVLDFSLCEINNLSDIKVKIILIKNGRKYQQIKFIIELKKDFTERLDTIGRVLKIVSPFDMDAFIDNIEKNKADMIKKEENNNINEVL